MRSFKTSHIPVDLSRHDQNFVLIKSLMDSVDTLGGIASICFRFHFQQILRMHGYQGCQKTRNFVRNSKILIVRSTIQPKLCKIKNHQEIHQNFLKNGKLFWILLNFGCMVDLTMSIFEFHTKCLVL